MSSKSRKLKKGVPVIIFRGPGHHFRGPATIFGGVPVKIDGSEVIFDQKVVDFSSKSVSKVGPKVVPVFLAKSLSVSVSS